MLERVWRKENPLHYWWEYKLTQPPWRTIWRFLKKLGIKLPNDPITPLLGIYPKKTITEKDTCTPMFTAALFTIIRTWKQPRCPLTGEWIKKLWYIYTMVYYSAIKRNTFESVLMRWVNLEPITQSEESQKEKILNINVYIWNLERQYWWTYFQGNNGDTDIEKRLMDTGGEGRKEKVGCMERVTWKHTLPYIK